MISYVLTVNGVEGTPTTDLSVLAAAFVNFLVSAKAGDTYSITGTPLPTPTIVLSGTVS